MDVFVRKLRSKLERVSPGWRYIHTHFGIGYRFAAEPMAPVEGEEPAPALEAHGEGGERADVTAEPQAATAQRPAVTARS